VSEDAARLGRAIGARLPQAAVVWLSEQRMAVAASLDGEGRVWASLLTGPAGFLRPVDDELLVVETRAAPADPLVQNLALRPELGVLVIDLARRKRLRLNGRGLLDQGRIFLAVEQAYANCPKYITPRRVEPVQRGPISYRRSDALDADQRGWTAGADCFFVASHHPQGGADASHRGGAPGFVEVLGPRSLAFPDYPGNNMFNTFGNIAERSRVGLLFLDFETGATLQLTGRATLAWTQEAAKHGASRAVTFELDEVLETHDGGVIGARVAEPPGA
jgi:predicted pyridoxine 5'-phosphate oxidase superfamily flavin-nucleotide-binding protein